MRKGCSEKNCKFENHLLASHAGSILTIIALILSAEVTSQACVFLASANGRLAVYGQAELLFALCPEMSKRACHFNQRCNSAFNQFLHLNAVH